ncbi:AraC family transcriptional regulator [Marivirga salinae]|uniref:AraC family transcriptional regulator n=1 Tax=Marivirga salinarum TaxID=3059078 RepID=A0AA51NBH8_9BACT|nr:AraC family transcriptional regulator [Marivirga sp. BDSF4-3]WMN12088.1 AraC family transcriptional regulator [Marivirga sp. BDSF4-3]
MMNHFIIWKDIRLFYGSHARSVTQHSHPIIQFVVAVEGTFQSKDVNGNWMQHKGLLLAPNHAHECDANGIEIISVEIDPESNLGEWILSNQLKSDQIIEYPSTQISSIDTKTIVGLIKNENWAGIRQIIESSLDFKSAVETVNKEKRIQEVVNYIKANIKQEITTQQLMEVAHLSESRLLHLFKEIKGLPIRNYILWHRLQIVLKQLLDGQLLTTAAYEAGFSDQAHLSRTFTKMIGVPPSLIAKNSKFIQVSFPQ